MQTSLLRQGMAAQKSVNMLSLNLRDYLDEKIWEFAIKWERGGGEGAQKEMRRPTATLPRVTKCLWFEFNLHSRFIRAPPISRWWGQSQQSYNIGQLDCFMSIWSSQWGFERYYQGLKVVVDSARRKLYFSLNERELKSSFHEQFYIRRNLISFSS